MTGHSVMRPTILALVLSLSQVRTLWLRDILHLSRRPGGSCAVTNHPCPLIPILVVVVVARLESTASEMEVVVSY